MDVAPNASAPLVHIDAATKVAKLDNHLISHFLDCQRKGYYMIERKIVPQGFKLPLGFGIAMHKGVEVFNLAKKQGMAPRDALVLATTAMRTEYDTYMDPQWTAQYALDIYEKHSWANAERLLSGYFQKYYGEPSQVLYAETPFAISLGHTPKHNYEIIYTGVMDAVIVYQGHTYVEETKTTGEFPSLHFFKKFEVLNALTGYVKAAQELLHEPPHGCVVRAIWKQPPPKTRSTKVFDDWFQSYTVTRSPDTIKEWVVNILYAVDDYIDARERGYFRRANSEVCTIWGECAYYRLCANSPGVREVIINQQYDVQEWDPLNRP
jgi:hypothetical protein